MKIKDIIIYSALGIIAILLIVNIFIGISHKKASYSYSEQRRYANTLFSYNLYEAAAEAYKEILKDPSLSANKQAAIEYKIADIYLNHVKDYEKALKWFTRVSSLHSKSKYKSSADKNIVDCLDRLGFSNSAERLRSNLVSLDKKEDKKKSNDVMVAKIGSTKIYKSQIIEAYENLPDEIKQNFKGKKGLKDFLSYYVGQELLYRMAKRRNIDCDPKVQAKIFDIKKQIIIQAAVISEIQDQLKNIDEEKIRLYYQAHKDKYKKSLDKVIQQVAEDYKNEKVQETMGRLQSKLMSSTDVYLFPELLTGKTE